MSQDAKTHHYSQNSLQWHGIYKEWLTMKYSKESRISHSREGGKWQRPKLWWMDGVVQDRECSESRDDGWSPGTDTHGRHLYGKPRLMVGCRPTDENAR